MATKRQLKKATKAAEAKAQVKTAEAVEKVAEKVEEVKVKAEAAEPEVKVEAKPKKKTVKKEFKTEIVLQYGEKEVNTKDMIAAVKKEWTKTKHKVSDIKSLELYVKPEDYAVYYVINGDTTGKVWL